MKMIRFAFIAGVLFCTFTVKAQDILFKKDKSEVKVVIVEITSNDVKYKLYGNPNNPTLTISKNDLIKIKTERGKEISFDQASATQQRIKKNLFKVDAFSYLASKLTFSYERSLATNRSVEFQLGIIGVGIKSEDIKELNGSFIRLGYKYFFKSKDNPNNSPLLQGGYFRPEFTFGFFNETLYTSGYSSLALLLPDLAPTQPTSSVSFYSAMANIGYQWIIADNFSIDLFFGAGFGGNSGVSRTYNYAVSGTSPLFFNAGVKVGVPF